MNSANYFKTSDTHFAAYLVSEGYPVISKDFSQERVEFLIDIDSDSQKLKEYQRLFLAGKARVEPENYLKNYRTLSRQARGGE